MPRINVADARRRAGLTQAALADRIGIRRASVIRIERGQTSPNVKVALAIARELDESVEGLFGGDER